MGDDAVEGDGEGHAECADDGERKTEFWFFDGGGVFRGTRAETEGGGGVAVTEVDVDAVEEGVAG